SIDADGAYSIGLQLDHQALIGVVVDLAGRIRARKLIAVDRPAPPAALPAMLKAVAALRRSARIEEGRLLGVGLAMPGPCGVGGLPSVGPTAPPGWEDYPIAAELTRRAGLPAIVENDATAAAIGERLHGVARNLASFVYLFVGTGLGAGLFLGGHPYKGSAHNAGEIGHMIVEPGGRACVCGNRGCLERYFSLRAAYEQLALPDPDHAAPELLAELLAKGDPRIERWIGAVLPPLRRAVNILESLLDPDAIVLGGFMPLALLQRLVARVE